MKKILLICAIIIVLAGLAGTGGYYYLKKTSMELDAQSKQYAENILKNLCLEWDLQPIFNAATPEFTAHVSAGKLEASCAYYSNVLGPVKDVAGLAGESFIHFYQWGSSVTADYAGRVEFKNDSALVNISLVKAGGKWLVTDFGIKPYKPFPTGAAATSPGLVLKAKALIDGYTGDPETLHEAYSYLNDALDKNPNGADAYAQLARIIYKAGYMSGYNYTPESLKRARQILDLAFKKEPNNINACITQGYVCLFEKNIDAARASYEKARSIDQNSAEARMLNGDIAFFAKDYKTAAAEYKIIIHTSVDNAAVMKAWGALASVYKAQKQYIPAEQAYLTVIKLDPGSPWALVNYSNMLIARGRGKDYDKAMENAAKALRLMDFPMGHYILSQASALKGAGLWKQKKYLQSGKYFELAALNDPSNVEALCYLGLYYREAAKKSSNDSLLAKSTGAFKQALTVNPSYIRAQKELETNRKLEQVLQ